MTNELKKAIEFFRKKQPGYEVMSAGIIDGETYISAIKDDETTVSYESFMYLINVENNTITNVDLPKTDDDFFDKWSENAEEV